MPAANTIVPTTPTPMRYARLRVGRAAIPARHRSQRDSASWKTDRSESSTEESTFSVLKAVTFSVAKCLFDQATEIVARRPATTVCMPK